jgi:SAM-dependent methyltransferase
MTRIGNEVGKLPKEYVNWTHTGPTHPEGVTPAIVRGRRVLDVGCSFGRHLMNFELHGADVFGIEFQRTYLQLSRPFAAQIGVRRPRVAEARAEQIPFRAESVDVVFCRLVLNYVYDIDGTIGEFARVLRTGGTLVLIVEPPSLPLRTLRTAKWIGNGRTIAFLLLGLLNTSLLALGGRQLVLRWPGRMHAQQSPAWPTDGWLSHRLAAHGFGSPVGDGRPGPQASGVFVATLHRRDERASTASAPLRAAAGDRRIGR